MFVDTSPIIHVLEDYAKLGARFAPVFAEHATGRQRFAVTTVTIAEVLTGPLRTGDEALVRRYRAVLESWQTVVMDAAMAESAARLHGSLRLKLPMRSRRRARSRSTPPRF